MQVSTKIPTVNLIAAGGCGINIVKKIMEEPEGDLTWASDAVEVIDTCKSNMDGLAENVTQHVLAEDGSGKNRATHHNSIQHTVGSLGIAFADVNIIVFSAAGGSGSVIGPIVAREACILGKNVVVVIVVDDGSEAECTNSIKTLKTLDVFAKENNFYFPAMIYSNIDAGRWAVNKTASTRVRSLINMLKDDAVQELDLKDKLHFLAPNTIDRAPAGIYSLGIVDSHEGLVGEGDGMPGECCLRVDDRTAAFASLTIDDQGRAFHQMSKVSFIGYSEKTSYYAINGRPIAAGVIQALRAKADLHSRTDDVEVSDMDSAFEGLDIKKTSTIL